MTHEAPHDGERRDDHGGGKPQKRDRMRAEPAGNRDPEYPAQLERLGRIAFPMIAEPGDSHYHRIPWDDALERTADAFKRAPTDRVFFYSSGRSSNEAAFLLQLVARVYGTRIERPRIYLAVCLVKSLHE